MFFPPVGRSRGDRQGVCTMSASCSNEAGKALAEYLKRSRTHVLWFMLLYLKDELSAQIVHVNEERESLRHIAGMKVINTYSVCR